MVYGLGWCHRVAFSYRHVLDRWSSLGRLPAGYFFLRCEYETARYMSMF